jgi:hypothetical protein
MELHPPELTALYTFLGGDRDKRGPNLLPSPRNHNNWSRLSRLVDTLQTS